MVMLPDDDALVFDESHLGSGLRTGELELPDDTRGGAASGLPPVNEELVTQLEIMGFPRVRCEKALRATGNNDAESAMEWMFLHMEDPGVFSPKLQLATGMFMTCLDIDVAESPVMQQSAGGALEAPSEMVVMLTEMGFTVNQAKKALREAVRP
jgi:ubiquitin carboxyl-terminal hydrolase 5/13